MREKFMGDNDSAWVGPWGGGGGGYILVPFLDGNEMHTTKDSCGHDEVRPCHP
jgi:hypothetical protein